MYAFSRTELIVVVATISLLIALLVPAVHNAREAARRNQFRNSLKNVGLAFYNYYDTHRVLPPGGIVDIGGRGHHGWFTQLLPYLEASPLYSQIDFDQPWDHPVNRARFRGVYSCAVKPDWTPQTDENGFGLIHFRANAECLSANSSRSFEQLEAKRDETWLVGELKQDFVPWGSPWNFSRFDGDFTRPQTPFGSQWRVNGKAGGHFVLGDGSVRFLNESAVPFLARSQVRH
ncbi:MAG: DUF1559 domain-containing protein [Planctomycetaceae bacterium]|nr:DUF1559 domain-containing protein [Planctomycetaceae bacterium]